MTHMKSALLATLALLLAVPAATRAQGVPSDGVLRGFQPSGDYTLVINGKPASGEIFSQDKIPAILILSSSLPSPVLLTPRAGSVETVHIMKVSKKPDGTVDLLADAVLAPLGQFQMAGENVTFTYEGKKVGLNPKPPLTGLRKGADLKTHSPEYVTTAKGYAPNAPAIASLKKETRPVTVRVMFGSWCPHCRQHVPYMLRLEDELKASKSSVKFEYFGLPRPPQAWSHPEVKKLNVKGVPTGIVYMNGREIGRIEGKGWDTPEVLLNKIISGQAAAKGK
jgi:thiol-disulfide isomerase/thioredoxin